MSRTLLLFIIIIVEGYVVLSAELLGIRQLLPFMGNGTDTVSIIIAAVLMPLAVGYYHGGLYCARQATLRRPANIRSKLLRNICISAAFLLVGLSTWTVTVFFFGLIQLHLTQRLIATSLYAILFIVTPVYLLGQTVPLISNYFSKEQIARITGKMLFFSTVGSFLGALFSTLVLMSIFGVHHTVSFSFVLLFFVVVLIAHSKRHQIYVQMMALMLVTALLLNSNAVMRAMNIIGDNQYATINLMYDKEKKQKLFIQNNGSSSALGPHGEKHEYAMYIEKAFITPLLNNPAIKPKDILVIGAGGFTFGLQDKKNNYIYIDIDPSLERVATEKFLKQKLTPNKKFVPLAAQSFLTTNTHQYDLILVDAYSGISLPEDLLTAEFFQSVRAKAKPGGIIAFNVILSPLFLDKFSRYLDATMRAVFPAMSTHIIGDVKGWETDPKSRNNTVYIYRKPVDGDERRVVYTRDKNTSFFDKAY